MCPDVEAAAPAENQPPPESAAPPEGEPDGAQIPVAEQGDEDFELDEQEPDDEGVLPEAGGDQQPSAAAETNTSYGPAMTPRGERTPGPYRVVQ